MTDDVLKQNTVANSLCKMAVQSQLNKLPQATRDRIAQIDFTLLFKGEAVRADLVERFSIAAAQATKDFTLYRPKAQDA
jgi:hypothetical protein